VRRHLLKAANKCVGWLDSQRSMVVLFPGEVVEMAHRLSSTGRPFMWVVRSETQPYLPACWRHRTPPVAGHITGNMDLSAWCGRLRLACANNAEHEVWELTASYVGSPAEWDAFDFWCWCAISGLVASEQS
jgi:hypothetical protein